MGETIRWACCDTRFGTMLVAVSDAGVCRLSFGEGEAELAAAFPAATLRQDDADPLVRRALRAVETGDARALPLDERGTAFQRRVWAELRRIPKGATRSYAEIARALGMPRAARAVGAANGANPVAVLTPCHRVTRADGSLGGYAYGTEVKAALLAAEAVAV